MPNCRSKVGRAAASVPGCRFERPIRSAACPESPLALRTLLLTDALASKSVASTPIVLPLSTPLSPAARRISSKGNGCSSIGNRSRVSDCVL